MVAVKSGSCTWQPLCYNQQMQRAIFQPFPTSGVSRGQIWRHQPATRRPRHFHTEPELNLVLGGTATFGVGENTLSARAGDLIWWTPGQDHELCSATPDFDLYVVGLSPEFSERVLGPQAAMAHKGPQTVRLSPEQVATLLPLCQLQECGNDTPAREYRVGEFWRTAHECRAVASNMHSITQRSLRLVQARPEMHRVEVAEQARVCPSEVSRYFHRDLGLTLRSYRTRLRLMRFIQLVDGGGCSLLTACHRAGFGSYSQCHRAFQQTLGYSPRAYFSTQVRQALECAYAIDMEDAQAKLIVDVSPPSI